MNAQPIPWQAVKVRPGITMYSPKRSVKEDPKPEEKPAESIQALQPKERTWMIYWKKFPRDAVRCE